MTRYGFLIGFTACITNAPSPTAKVSASTATAKVGQVVTLDASRSTDTSKNGLTYAWQVTESPVGSTASIVNAASPAAWFVPDREGTYTLRAVLADSAQTNAGSVTLTVSGSCFTVPASLLVNPGEPTSLTTGYDATCGSLSTVTWHWQLESQPTDSRASLSADDSAAPVLTTDVAGAYVAAYSVGLPGGGTALAGTVTITANDCAPTLTVTTPSQIVLWQPPRDFDTEPPPVTFTAAVSSPCDRTLDHVEWRLLSDNGAVPVTPASAVQLTLAPPGGGIYRVGAIGIDAAGQRSAEVITEVDVIAPIVGTDTPFSSLQLVNDVPWVSYASGSASLMLAHLDLGTYQWISEAVPTKPVGAAVTFNRLQFHNGLPRIAYEAAGELHYARRATASSGWTDVTVDTSLETTMPIGFVLNAADEPRFSLDKVSGANYQWLLAGCDAASVCAEGDTSGNFTTPIYTSLALGPAPDSIVVGLASLFYTGNVYSELCAGVPAYQCPTTTSISGIAGSTTTIAQAVASGPTGQMRVLFFNATQQLTYARCVDSDCTHQTTLPLQGHTYTSMAITVDAQDHAHMTWDDYEADRRYYAAETTNGLSIEILDTGTWSDRISGNDVSIQLSAAGHPRVVYRDQEHGRLMYWQKVN